MYILLSVDENGTWVRLGKRSYYSKNVAQYFADDVQERAGVRCIVGTFNMIGGKAF